MTCSSLENARELFLEGRKHARARLGRVLVVGLGKSGKQAADYCAMLLEDRVDALFVAAGADNAAARSYVGDLAGRIAATPKSHELGSSQGVDVEGAFAVRYGDDGVAALAAVAKTDAPEEKPFDVCIVSPGIPYWERLYQDALACSREVISEVEFAWRESRSESLWVAVTGTNGKTTTTACCAALLQASGFKARAVGNIGDVCLKAVLDDDTEVYVAEVSSYQLASTSLFAPNVALVLNITPDHVHWHKTLEAYRDAKFNVLSNLSRAALPPVEADGTRADGACAKAPAELRSALAVLDATNDVVRAKVRELKAQPAEQRGFDYVPLGTSAGFGGDMRQACGSENAAFIDDAGRLTVAYRNVEHVLCRADELQMHGLHNAANALAAAVCAIALGADDARLAQALKDFPPLEHRIEPCGTVAGVRCFNDSKATNVDATLKALEAFPDTALVLLLGGEDKGTDLRELVEQTVARARVAVCYGQSADRFMAAFDEARGFAPEAFEVVRCEHMEDALQRALQLARPGEAVLLSPACASFDEFNSFEERGEVFKRLVAHYAEEKQGKR